jgi:hypothetical protein
VVREQI